MASECWLWAGNITPIGYGQLYIKGSRPYRSRLAHIIVYEALVGTVPKGLQLDHLCRVRHCVNPDHLEPVTVKENVLRGVGITANNAKKTHCPQGHPYSEYAQTWQGSTWRRCSKCHAIKEAERRRRISISQVN